MEDAAPIPVRNNPERPDPLRPYHPVLLSLKSLVQSDVFSLYAL